MADVAKDYLGIPRDLIPWFPTIDAAACTNCGICVSTCKHGVHGYRDDHTVFVESPYSCEVFCETCRFACPVDAISFPNRKATSQILRELRAKYPVE
jgi:NAD-dependent dihydropyrimidine dehydrogenase PreA subunit